MSEIKKQKKVRNNGLNPMLIGEGDIIPPGAEKLSIEDLSFLVGEGQKLTAKLVKLLSQFAFDYYDTFIQTYALSQIIAYLFEVAKAKGLDAKAMQDMVMPIFQADAKEMVDGILKEMGRK